MNDTKKIVGTVCVCASIMFVVLLCVIFVPKLKPKTDEIVDANDLIVPDFVGLLWSDVANDASLRGQFAFSIVDGNDTDYDTGEILSQIPDAGSVVTKGQRIELVVNGRVEIPEMLRYKQDEAEKLLNVLGLTCKIKTEYSDDIEDGCVMLIEPVKGTVVDFGTEVTLTISKGRKIEKIRVPDVTGLEEKDALKILSDAGFVCTIESVAEGEVQPGQVSSTSPVKNSLVDKGSPIVVRVNNKSADKMIKVPDNLVGKKLDEVTKLITESGLTVGSVTLDDDSASERNTVVQMSVVSGVELKEGESIDLIVSSGRSAPKTLSTQLELPDVNMRMDLKVYQNGELVDNASIILSEKEEYLLTFTGVNGFDNIMVTLDDSVYAQLTFNYDDQNVIVNMLNKSDFEITPTPSATFNPWPSVMSSPEVE